MPKTDVIRLRITPELKQLLQAAAAADRRTMSNYIENLIAQDLQAKGLLDSPDKKP